MASWQVWTCPSFSRQGFTHPTFCQIPWPNSSLNMGERWSCGSACQWLVSDFLTTGTHCAPSITFAWSLSNLWVHSCNAAPIASSTVLSYQPLLSTTLPPAWSHQSLYRRRGAWMYQSPSGESTLYLLNPNPLASKGGYTLSTVPPMWFCLVAMGWKVWFHSCWCPLVPSPCLGMEGHMVVAWR